MKKKGQMKLSFGMIFSIILIIIFIIFAIYAINKFLNVQKELKYTQFTEDFQADVDKLWKSSQGSKKVQYSLPSEVSAICFMDDEFENLIYKSEKRRRGIIVDHLDIQKTLDGQSTLCIPSMEGRINMIISKGYGEALVSVSKV